jgi:biopolymer transport protein ExbB
MRFWSLLLTIVFMMAAATPANAWWENGWAYRKSITVDTSPSGLNVSGPVGRTTVLVRLHQGNFSFPDALDNGADLRFVASDDKTPLPFHVESFDKETGVATIWVSVPNLVGGEKNQIWMYYGNSTAPAGEDIAGTFDPDYSAVYHFNDAPGAPTSDKTANGNNAQNAPAGVNDGGIIARSGRFPGAGPITIAASPSLAMPAGQPLTFSAWVKPAGAAPEQAIFSRGPFVLGLAGGVPFVTAGGGRISATQPLKANDWSHLAVVADGTTIRLYVNGVEGAAASAALPALDGPIAIGGGAQPFNGEIDEARISKVARPAAMLLAEATNQGPTDKLVAFGADEEQGGGHGAMATIVMNTPLDAWIVIGILGVMLVIAFWVMWSKYQYLARAKKANKVFVKHFRRMDDLVPVDQFTDIDAKERALIQEAPLKHLYDVGMEELAHRHRSRGQKKSLSAETIEAMRASVDAQQVEENEKLDKWMVLLTIAISGGPFIGLLGTVLGVMITFGAVAAAGEVNINAIAPGIAAALLATVAGLAVAIPALFGYNYLNAQIVAIANEMRVFVDRLITRLAETHHHATPPPMSMAAE